MPHARTKIPGALLLALFSLLFPACSSGGESQPPAGGSAQSAAEAPPAAPSGAEAAAAPDSGAEAAAAPAAGAGAAPAAPAEAAPGGKAPGPAGADDSPVATVNGKPIPRSVFWGQLAFQVDESLIVGEDDFSVPEPPLEDKVLVLDILIRMEAAAQEAAREGFEPAGAELDRVAAEAAENYGGLAETEKAVTESGGTMEEFRETAARSAALKNWRDISFLGQARATDEEAEEYYRQHQEEFTHGDEVRAMHIMFPLPFAQSGAPAQRGRVWDKAREALALARGGMNFEDLMVQYMDKTTLGATANGQLGWVGRGASFPELEAALFEMKPGDVSDIVETPFSLHILKAVDARPAGVTPFSEVRPEIVAFLTDFKTDRLMRAKIDELVAQADVKIMDPELAKGWEEFRLAGSLVAEPAPGEADAGD